MTEITVVRPNGSKVTATNNLPDGKWNVVFFDAQGNKLPGSDSKGEGADVDEVVSSYASQGDRVYKDKLPINNPKGNPPPLEPPPSTPNEPDVPTEPTENNDDIGDAGPSDPPGEHRHWEPNFVLRAPEMSTSGMTLALTKHGPTTMVHIAHGLHGYAGARAPFWQENGRFGQGLGSADEPKKPGLSSAKTPPLQGDPSPKVQGSTPEREGAPFELSIDKVDGTHPE